MGQLIWLNNPDVLFDELDETTTADRIPLIRDQLPPAVEDKLDEGGDMIRLCGPTIQRPLPPPMIRPGGSNGASNPANQNQTFPPTAWLYGNMTCTTTRSAPM